MNFHEVNGKREAESEAQYLAFCRYRDAGEKRNATAVARELDVSKTTVFRWKKEQDWDMRVAMIDATVKGYIENGQLEANFQENMGKIGTIADGLMAKLETFIETEQEMSIKDLYQATRALLAVLQIKENCSWYGRVVEALKHIAKTENAQQASEQFVKEQLPKQSQRTRDPDDAISNGNGT